MEASPARVIQYFNGEKQNLIPLFQRPYSWKKDNWLSLWDDLMVQYELDDKSSHFMGAIVSVPAKSVPVGVSKFLIIDGQQRLTTVCILLCAIRDCLDENAALRIQEVYLTNKYRDPDDTLKFVPTHVDRQDFKDLISKTLSEHASSAVANAYRFFRDKIKTGLDPNSEPVKADRLLLSVEHSLEVVMINLGETDDPYLIFESLNFKGEPLTQADLVRNYVLMQFRHSLSSGGDQERIHRDYWKPMENSLGDRLTEFLRYYLMRQGDVINLGGIYASIKTRLKGLVTSLNVEEEVKSIRRFSDIYQRILQPDLIANDGVRNRVKNINNLSVATSYPFLLRLFDALENEIINSSELERCLGLIESFIVRRSVCGVPTNNLNKLFLQWCRSFPMNDHFEWLRKSMSSGSGGRRFPSDLEFGDAFRLQPQYGRGATRFILEKLESNFGHKEPVDLSSATIEHVLPRTLSSEWKSMLGENADEVYERYIDTFGNLTLTAYNAELSNLPFEQKKDRLKNTHIDLNKWIVEQSAWTETEISARANMLLVTSKIIWTGPHSN